MISTVMLFIVTLVVGILFYRVMIGFFVPLFLAALLVVIFRPMHERIGSRLGGRPRLAALATTAAILLVVLLPAGLVFGVAAVQGTTLVSRVNYNNLNFALQRTRARLGLAIENPEPFERLPNLVTALGELSNLEEPRQPDRFSNRLREMRAVLNTLREDFQPLGDAEQLAIEKVESGMERLGEIVREAGRAPAEPNVDRAAATARGASPAGENDVEAVDEEDPAALEQANDPADGGPKRLPPVEALREDSAEASAETDYRSPEERYQRALMRLNRSIQEMADVLLGGSLRGQLKMWANPSRRNIERWFEQLSDLVQPRLVSVTSATGEFLASLIIGAAILIIALYFFLVDGPGMVRTLMRLSPLDDRYELKLLMEFERTSRAVVLATVLSALAQGVLATIGYYFAGLNSIALLFLLTSFLALIPFLGAAGVWLPAAIWLGLVEERWGAAIALAIYGTVVVSSIDNLIKVFVLHGRSQLHPLLALLSVLGGVQVFGPIGILVGPMVVVFLQSTLEILNQELGTLGSGEQEGRGFAFAGIGTPAAVRKDDTEEERAELSPGAGSDDAGSEDPLPADRAAAADDDEPPARAKDEGSRDV
jgi:predicted PurR-regulated permease PerM